MGEEIEVEMPSQLNIFQPQLEHGPEGFEYEPQLISPAEEQALLKNITGLPFREFEFHGYLGKRRVVSFGWRYEYSGGGKLQKANDLPGYLLNLRRRAAEFARMNEDDLQQALVTEYRPGAGIGWHRDKAVFGSVVGISLISECVLRFRRIVGTRKRGDRSRKNWERLNVLTAPRSAYLLSGPARSDWEHSIAGVDRLRYSITFRNVR